MKVEMDTEGQENAALETRLLSVLAGWIVEVQMQGGKRHIGEVNTITDGNLVLVRPSDDDTEPVGKVIARPPLHRIEWVRVIEDE